MSWVDTLTKLMTPEYTKLFPTLFYECSGCRGTGWCKINIQFGAHETAVRERNFLAPLVTLSGLSV